MFVSVLALSLLTAPVCGDWSAGYRSPRSVRRDTRERVGRMCRALGGDADACAVLDYVTLRESSFDPCAVHTLGPNEYGLGPHGLSVGLHLRWWDADADSTVLHVPEVSSVVVFRLWRRAVRRYGARTWRRANAVYAGRIAAKHLDNHKDNRFCFELNKRGVDCNDAPGLGVIGGMSPYNGQDTFVASVQRLP